ncbi:MAG: PIN domain-containing protein [Pseudomonadota bacterium]|nr:PIN domain-containing protein [Pseudomonadota bacterium]
MAGFLLDTDICLRAIRDREEGLRVRFNTHADELGVSPISLAALFEGAERTERPERNRRIVKEFAMRLTVRAFDHDAAIHAGEIRAASPVDADRAMIAATARANGLVLVTGAPEAYRAIPGLRLESW